MLSGYDQRLQCFDSLHLFENSTSAASTIAVLSVTLSWPYSLELQTVYKIEAKELISSRHVAMVTIFILDNAIDLDNHHTKFVLVHKNPRVLGNAL